MATISGRRRTARLGYPTAICGSRVYRGGSWNDDPKSFRSAFRNKSGYGNNSVGFRVARTLPP